MSLLITRPNHDSSTAYLYYWSQKILSLCTKINCKFFDLKGDR